jgi:ketosteroid isomerase-like protein
MSAAEAEIAAAVETLRRAMIASDRAALTAVCAPQLSYGHSGGTLETRDEFIDANTNGVATWKRLAFEDQTIDLSGDVAVVRHMMVGETEHTGGVHPIDIGILLVWQRQSGAWKLLARQAYKFR